MAKWSQISEDEWAPAYSDSVAVLVLEPAELTRRYGIVFAEGEHNLGPCLYAFIQITGGRRFGLERVFTNPKPGTTVHGWPRNLPEVRTRGEPFATWGEIAEALELEFKDVAWIQE